MSYLAKQILSHQIRQFKNSIFQLSQLPFSGILPMDALNLMIEHSANDYKQSAI
ncbi:MAG: hypothetical protein GQ582_06185 [Methyloprofundus sp.]|nr:hypothetical protein [Methyloprofundus sp.]